MILTIGLIGGIKYYRARKTKMIIGTANHSIILRLLFTSASGGRYTHHVHLSKCVCPITGDVYAYMPYEMVQLLAECSPSVYRDYSFTPGNRLFRAKYSYTLRGGKEIGCLAFKLSVDPFGSDTTMSLDVEAFIKFFNKCLVKSRGYVYKKEDSFFGPMNPGAASLYGSIKPKERRNKGEGLSIIRTFKFHRLHVTSLFWYNDLLRFL